MAKIIKYKFLSSEINRGTKENPDMEQTFLSKSMPWNEVNEEIAKREAWGGEYEIVDDGQPAPAEKPSQLDIIEAQLTYTAMMTDTLLPEV